MTPNQWPWSPEEEAQWEKELQQSPVGQIGDLIDEMVSNGLGSVAYDPLLVEEEPEEVLIP